MKQSLFFFYVSLRKFYTFPLILKVFYGHNASLSKFNLNATYLQLNKLPWTMYHEPQVKNILLEESSSKCPKYSSIMP